MKKNYLPDSYAFIFPNIFTTANLFSGFFSVISSLKGNYELASYAIFFAAIFDLIDGRIARMLNKASAFGKEYDSIADIVSFGIAPSILAYLWGLNTVGNIGWLFCFLYLACGALRLARYNVLSKSQISPDYFIGMPIPIGAGVICSLILFYSALSINFFNNYVMLIFIIILSLLMVSTVKFASFKNVLLRGKKSVFTNILVLVLVIILVSINHEVMLFFIFFLYVLINLTVHFYKIIFKKNTNN